MSFTTFNVNDIVFVDNIGYGTIMDCGNAKSVAVKEVPAVLEKRQSIYFDPELFNSEAESTARQKSQSAVLVPNPKSQTKIEPEIQVQGPPPSEKKAEDAGNEAKSEKKVSIVKVKLEGNINTFVYTADYNIRKHVIVPVRPLFVPAIGILNIKIEIGKTIESFKKEILDLMGLKQAHYYNVKLFTTSPSLCELNSPGKTIWQCGIRESSILTMVAEHGFCLQTVQPHLVVYYSVTNNGLTFVSLPRKPKVAQNVVIALPPSQPTQTPPAEQPGDSGSKSPQKEKKEEPKPTDKEEKKVEGKEQKKQGEGAGGLETKVEAKQKEAAEKQAQPPQTLMLKGDKVLRSGKQYFEVRLDKLPQNSLHLRIGLSAEDGKRKWLYSPLSLQKVYEENNEVKATEPYGMTFKQNDAVGVLTRIDKHRNMKVSFFKNNVNLGVCFEAKIEQICFVFEIGSEAQISLDTRAQLPIDSYRLR